MNEFREIYFLEISLEINNPVTDCGSGAVSKTMLVSDFQIKVIFKQAL